jgi:NADH:ubiquinone oxidoreductase subunit 5 (subunit L)/multisubunit Na+/H+ antiporter MnhA subunit
MIFLPLVLALLAALVMRWAADRRGSGWVLLVLLLGTVAAAALAVNPPPAPIDIPYGPALTLHLDPVGFARTMLLLVPLIAAPVIGYAWLAEPALRRTLVPLLFVFVATMELLVLTRDLLALLIAWELVGLLSWLLIGLQWREARPVGAARTAFVTTRIGDLGLYVAAGLLFASTGTLRFDAMAQLGRPAADLVALGLLVAAAAKSAQVPFAQWLFAAMAGPTPVSALLHSATLVAAGAYLLIVTSPFLTAVPWYLPAVTVVGLVTVVAGGVVAALHREAKPALAGSTSAQYGLMFIAVGVGAPALAGAQLVAHAAYKSLLFLGAGVAMHTSGSGSLESMRLGRRHPVAALSSLVGLAALAALPLTSGGWTKEAIAAAAEERTAIVGLLVMASGALTAFYAARLGLLMWRPRGRPDQGAPRWQRPSRTEWALVPLAVATLLLSVLWLPGGAAWLVGDSTHGFTGGGVAAALLSIALGVGVAFVLDSERRLWALGGAAGARIADTWVGALPGVQGWTADAVLTLAAVLARFDQRVVDAGVRATAALGLAAARLLAARDVVTVDGSVRAIAEGTMRTADGSRRVDERAVDGTVEATGRGVARAGHESRRLQSGMSHEYLQLIAAGLAVALVVLLVAR